MGDLYTEKLVKRKTPQAEKIIRAAMIAATALSAAGIVLTPMMIPVFLTLAAADYLILPRFDLEYEYLYVNGELDVDKILAKKKRKRAVSVSMEHLELLAPYHAQEMERWKKDRCVQVTDCSSGEKKDVYGLVTLENGKKKLLLFEPDEVMLRDIKRIAPGKVKLFK